MHSKQREEHRQGPCGQELGENKGEWRPFVVGWGRGIGGQVKVGEGGGSQSGKACS